MSRLPDEQHRAALSVQALTGVAYEIARRVVMEGRHDLYDGSVPSLIDEEQTLEYAVREVIRDHLDTETPANAWSVARLLEVVDASWATVWGDSLELRLPNDQLILTGEGDWGAVTVQDSDEEIPTGVPDDCPNPALVADALARIAPAPYPMGPPENEEGTTTVEHASSRTAPKQCARCGGDLVPVVYGMPDPDLMQEADEGRALLGGCLTDQRGPTRACPACSTAG